MPTYDYDSIEETERGNLYEDGAVAYVSETLRLVVHIEPDPETSISDYGPGCYGEVADARYCSDSRPEHFNGAARKLSYGNDGPWWWQPPADVPAGHLPTLAAHVAELLAFGFRQVGVDLQECLSDSDGGEHWVTVAEGWLCGIDSDDPAYLREVAEDIARDLAA